MKKRLISIILATALLFACSVCSISLADTDEAEKETASGGAYYDENGEMQLVAASTRPLDGDFSFTRVLLGTGSVSTLTLSLYGGYYIEENMRSMLGTSDGAYVLTVTVSGSNVRIYNGSSLLYSGSNATLMRVNLNESAGYLTVSGCGSGYANGKSYLGNLALSVNSDGSLRVINIIPTAHYLYGLVPYEMSESWELETLRSQAVTCKTYAFAFPGSSSDYDITDSVSYQGYRGYKAGYPKCMQACVDVCGDLLTKDGRIYLTFYGATNGGETENPKNAFGSPELEHAYEVKFDNLDFEFATNRRQTLGIRYGQPIENELFKSLIETEAEKELGCSVEALSVIRAYASDPKYPGVRRNMTMLQLEVYFADENGNEFSMPLGIAMTKLKSVGIFTKNYKIYWGSNVPGGYEVYFCRYGHGIGLSQCGAQAHSLHGFDYREILAFYFSLFDMTVIREDNPERPFAYTKDVLAYGTVTGSRVNFRSGPSTNYPSLFKVVQGDHLDVVGERNGWLMCIYNNTLGYIRGDYTDILLFPAPGEGIITTAYGEAVADTVITDVPSVFGETVGELPLGTSVTVLRSIGSYLYITSEAGDGFVPAECVNILAAPSGRKF